MVFLMVNVFINLKVEALASVERAVKNREKGREERQKIEQLQTTE